MIVIMVLAALLLRIHVIRANPPIFPPGWGGEMSSVATAIAGGEGFASPYWVSTGKTALVPPVYPYLLAFIYQFFGVHTEASGFAAVYLNAVLSAITTLLIYLLGKKLFDPWVGLIAGWLWALYPVTGYADSVYIWSTSLYTMQLTLILLLGFTLTRKQARWIWFGFGLIIGITCLTEVLVLLVAPLLLAWALYGQRTDVRRIGLVIAAVLIVIVPWTVRNTLVFGQVMFLRSGLGLELNRGLQEDDFATMTDPIILPNRSSEEFARYVELGEINYAQEKLNDVVSYAVSHPAEYALRTIRHFMALWTGNREIIYLGWYPGSMERRKQVLYSLPAILAAAGLFLSFRVKHPARLVFLGLLILHSGVYYFTPTPPRYRVPIEPELFILSVFAIQYVFLKLEARRPRRTVQPT
ncbi:MAG: glycosyltransferase family 39 protein [Anaerolineae bacterium]|nr:glycosyltransferase family 39 protein [Anaerolineae bacterium]